MKEIWRSVPEYEGRYEVSSFGNFRSLPRQTKSGRSGGKRIVPSLSHNGYWRVTFSKDGIARRISAHRVVLMAFVGSPQKGQECRHLDGNRANNRITNLCWGTRSENAFDRISHGTHVCNQGEKHGMTTLSNADAQEIIRLGYCRVKQDDIAARFGINQATVSRIVNGRGWTHLDRGIA